MSAHCLKILLLLLLGTSLVAVPSRSRAGTTGGGAHVMFQEAQPEADFVAAAEGLPLLDFWYVIPDEERAGEVSGIMQQVRVYAATHLPDLGLSMYREALTGRTAFTVFVEFGDMKATKEGKDELDKDEAWNGIYQRLAKTAGASSSRSLLFPVAGVPSGGVDPRCRMVTRMRMQGARRALAKRRVCDLVDHLNAAYEGLAARAYTEDLALPDDLYLFVDYEALWERTSFDTSTSWEQTRRLLLADDRYVELTERLAEVLAPEPTQEAMMLGE